MAAFLDGNPDECKDRKKKKKGIPKDAHVCVEIEDVQI